MSYYTNLSYVLFAHLPIQDKKKIPLSNKQIEIFSFDRRKIRNIDKIIQHLVQVFPTLFKIIL